MNGYKLTIEANGVDVSSSFTVERENGDAYLQIQAINEDLNGQIISIVLSPAVAS